MATADPCVTMKPHEEVDAMAAGKTNPHPRKTNSHPRPGDVIEVAGHKLGEAARTGEILEVLGEPGNPHFRVRWEDGHESIFYPSNDAVVRPARRAAAATRR
jgi:hypothetical protein